ncbi:MAG: hypothetical protein ACR2NA_08385 [Solirubrobacterales bacterium]
MTTPGHDLYPRRAVLRAASATALAAAAGLAVTGCGDEGEIPEPSSGPVEDAGILRALAGQELAVASALTEIPARRAGAGVAALLRAMQRRDRAHARRLTEHADRLTGTAGAPPRPTPLVVSASLAEALEQVRARRSEINRDQVAALVRLADQRARRDLASILAVDAEHLTVLAAARADSPVGQAVRKAPR